jgi:hypothetical protein
VTHSADDVRAPVKESAPGERVSEGLERARLRTHSADYERLIRAAWCMCVEEQAARSAGWSMAKSWAFKNLREAMEPFKTEQGTLLIDGTE